MSLKPLFKTSSHDKNAYYDIDTLAIDVSWVAKRHEHALGQRFATSDGRMSGHVYGALTDIMSLVRALKPRQLAFCYDRGYQWRLEMVPGYKADRRVPKGGPTKWSPAPDVERLFRTIPGLQLSAPDMEADDMLGWLAVNQDRQGALVVYTKDRDLWQLVHDGNEIGCVMPDKSKGPRARPTRSWVREDTVKAAFGVGPASLAKLKALEGDSSDKTKGLIGARKPGKKSALKEFALDISSDDYFDNDIAEPDINAPDWLATPLLDERQRLLANYQITSLPDTIQRIEENPVVESKADIGAALDLLAEFECGALMAQVEPFFTTL